MSDPVNSVSPGAPRFNTHKVFAAVGIILTVTILILGGLWWYFGDQLWDEVEENQTVKVSTSSAKPATNSATTSAE